MIDHRVFIYGSLAPGKPNAHVLQPLGGEWQRGTVLGRLEQTGWGAAMGFPGLVLDSSGSAVDGWLLTSEALPKHWTELDEFEGEEYQRIPAQVRLEDGTVVEAWVYGLRG